MKHALEVVVTILAAALGCAGVIGFVLCDPALRDDVVQFFRDRLRDAPQVLAQGIERMDTCLARRRAAQPSVAAFLARY